MARKPRRIRRGAELHAAGLIWEGSPAEFRRIIDDVSAEVERLKAQHGEDWFEKVNPEAGGFDG